jgi:hypothetical protein
MKDHRCPAKEYIPAHSLRSFTLDQASQVEREVFTTVLVTIREWKNSFVHINRIPLEILSLIPTFLSSENDRLRASWVCRHWRRTFLRCPEVWSLLSLSKRRVRVKTVLERVKGFPLDVFVGHEAPVGTIALLSSHIKQIRSLHFKGCVWGNVNNFSRVCPGPLPLLHTLDLRDKSSPRRIDSSPTPLFRNAINLKVFCLHSDAEEFPSLHRFLFPNLTSFELRTTSSLTSSASLLLGFLETSPMLQTVYLAISQITISHDAPPQRVVVLPNVKELTLISEGSKVGYEFATRLSCPSARHTFLVHKQEAYGAIPRGVFPTSVELNTIVSQYTTSPVEEVVLQVETTPVIRCNLAFRSSDTTLTALEFEASEDGTQPQLRGACHQLVTQATQTILDHPHLTSVKRLRVCHGLFSAGSFHITHIANDVRRLFGSLGPLDEFIIHSCDPRPFLRPFLDLPNCRIEGPIVFPQIKEFTISHPKGHCDDRCETAIVSLAISQHARGIPFERAVIRMSTNRLVALGMEEKLRHWVGSVECHYEEQS